MTEEIKKFATFKALGLLLTYPKSNHTEILITIKEVLKQESLLTGKTLALVNEFIDSEITQELIDLQEDYVETFDRSRSFCLHLFEHVYGDSRDRGQAMIDLAEMYHEQNLFIDSGELPDYIPLFLEFLSHQSYEDVKVHLADIAHIIAGITAKLKKAKNKFYPVFNAINKLTNVRVDKSVIEKALKSLDEDDQSLEALDKEWEETPAFTNDPNIDCNSCDAIETAENIIQQMKGTQK